MSGYRIQCRECGFVIYGISFESLDAQMSAHITKATRKPRSKHRKLPCGSRMYFDSEIIGFDSAYHEWIGSRLSAKEWDDYQESRYVWEYGYKCHNPCNYVDSFGFCDNAPCEHYLLRPNRYKRIRRISESKDFWAGEERTIIVPILSRTLNATKSKSS